MGKVITVILSLLFAAVCHSQDTDLRLYRPFNSNPDQVSVQINKTVSGWCWEQSHADNRKDAWRCMVGNKIYDPCFVKSHGEKKQAVCPNSPWQSEAILITVENSLNPATHKSLDMSKDYPWAIELLDGTQCQTLVDSQQTHDNLPVRYHCNNQSFLIGHLQRCKGLWQVLQKQGDSVSTVSIKRAWY